MRCGCETAVLNPRRVIERVDDGKARLKMVDPSAVPQIRRRLLYRLRLSLLFWVRFFFFGCRRVLWAQRREETLTACIFLVHLNPTLTTTKLDGPERA